MAHDPCSRLYDAHVFGEFGDVNPSVTDSSTFSFLSPKTMEERFSNDIEGCFLYSRHWNPVNKNLAKALSAIEGTEAAQVTASGMAAISCTLLQLCDAGDEIICERTIYGGTYALLKNIFPRFGIQVHFVDINELDSIRERINPRTRVIFCESLSNPLLEVADLPKLSTIARANNLKLVVDNTFSPLVLSPARLGADIVIHSLTKFMNGSSDCVAGAVCGPRAFIDQLTAVNDGMAMLLGPVLDSYRSASIWKNLHTLHLRMRKHSENAMCIAQNLQADGLEVIYPGLPNHPAHTLLDNLHNKEFGYGGMLVLKLEDEQQANDLMVIMQQEKVGLLAVSLGYFRTLFSAPGHSTSSEIPEEEQQAMGLNGAMIRFSIGLDSDPEKLYKRLRRSLEKAGILKVAMA